MSIFSKVKKGKHAAEESKATTETTENTEPPKKVPASSSAPTPIDPTRPARTAEEVRERIAANRKRQSDIVRQSPATSQLHVRAKSEYIFPVSGWQTHRGQEPVTFDAVFQGAPMDEAEMMPPPLIVRGRASTEKQERTLSRRYSEEFLAYSNPREVPLPPPSRTRPPPRTRSRRLVKRNTSVSQAPMQQESEDDSSSSSRNSARDSASSTGSTASSVTSTSSIYNESMATKHTSTRIFNFSRPMPASPTKKKPELVISLPYNCNADPTVVEEVKTAKSLIPTWRYEDLGTDNRPPIHITSLSAAHSRQSSWGHSRKTSLGSIFKRRNLSTTAF